MNISKEDPRIRDYLDGFFGYGNLDGRFWAIGMEEGGDSSTIIDRVEAWEKLGRGATVDIKELHELIDQHHWFSVFAHSQTTWQGVIKIVLAAMSTITPCELDTKEYQRSRFARSDGDTAMLDLMPLPSPDSKIWAYKSLYPTRDKYLNEMAPLRIGWIKQKIREHKPKVVIMLSKSYRDPYWNQVHYAFKEVPYENGPFDKGNRKRTWLLGQTKATAYVICDHPAAQVPDRYYAQIGAAVGDHLKRIGNDG